VSPAFGSTGSALEDPTYVPRYASFYKGLGSTTQWTPPHSTLPVPAAAAAAAAVIVAETPKFRTALGQPSTSS
jgi:hypothetical protein